MRKPMMLKWEDCLKIDLTKAEEKEKLWSKARNGEVWKKITAVAVQQHDKSPASPLQQSSISLQLVFFIILLVWII